MTGYAGVEITSTGAVRTAVYVPGEAPVCKVLGPPDLATPVAGVRAVRDLGARVAGALTIVAGVALVGLPGKSPVGQAGAWWAVLTALVDADLPVTVVPLTVVKRFAVGSGQASHDRLLSAVAKAVPEGDVADLASHAVPIIAAGIAAALGGVWAPWSSTKQRADVVYELAGPGR